MLPKSSGENNRSDSMLPVMETVYSKAKAVIVSGDPLISENLAFHFQSVGVDVEIFDLVTVPGKSSYTHTPLSHSSQLASLSADYFVYVHGDSVVSDDCVQVLCKITLEQGKKILFVYPFHYPSISSTQNYLAQYGPRLDYRLVQVHQPYGLPQSVDPLNPVFHLLKQIPSSILSTAGISTDQLSPIYIDDVCFALLKILFSSRNLPLYLLASLENYQASDFIYQLKEILESNTDQRFQLDIKPVVDHTIPLNTDLAISTQAHLDWHPEVTLKQGVGKILPLLQFDSLPTLPIKRIPVEVNIKEGSVTQPKKKLLPLHYLPSSISLKINRVKKLSRLMVYLTIILGVFLFLLSPLIWTGINTYYAATSLKLSVVELEKGSPDNAKSLSLKAKAKFENARNGLAISKKQLFFVSGSYYEKYDRLLDSAVKMSEVLVITSDSVKLGQGLYQAVFGRSQLDIFQSTHELKSNVQSLYNELSLIQASLAKVEFSSRLEFVAKLNEVKEKIPELRSRLELSLAVLDVLPSIIGQNQPRSYLVLLQNNAELRPTGGFIGSIALVTFKDGQMVELKVEDVYNLDGQLGGHVEPPAALKKYLESHWYLRDSNWHPDFPTAAKQISWFYEKEAGRAVDGVIGINIFTLQSILSATGPITIPDLGEQITSENLFDRAEYRSEVNFFPGSTQKKDFLAGLAQSLLTKFKEGGVSLSPLVKSLDQTLSESNIVIAFNDTKLQELIESHNWSGSLQNVECPVQFTDSPCTSSTFSLIEANIGINKSNYFLKRKIDHNALIDKDGKLTHNIKVSYHNTSPSHSWPGGKYKTYTRFYAPLNTQLIEVLYKNEPISPEEVSTLSGVGLQEFAFVYEVDPNEQAVLEIKLGSTQIVSTKSPLSTLSLNWQKQSGTNPDQLSVSIEFPSFLTPTQISMPAANTPQRLVFTAPFAADLSFAAKFRH